MLFCHYYMCNIWNKTDGSVCNAYAKYYCYLQSNSHGNSQQNNPCYKTSNECSSKPASISRTFTWRGTDLTDSCSSSTNLDQSIRTINVSPIFECIDHVSGSHITTATRVCHSGCESGLRAITWACQLGVLQVDWSKVTRTLVTYYSREALLQWLGVVLQLCLLKSDHRC